MTHDSFVIEYNKQAIHFIENNDIDKAKLTLKTVKNILSTEAIRNLALVKSVTHHSYGLLYKSLGRLTAALNSFNKALNVGKNGRNLFTLASSHLNLSQIFLSTSQYDKALTHGLLSLKSCRFENTEMLSAYLCIGSAYKHKGDYLAAMKYFNAGSEISKKLYGDHYKYSIILSREYEKIIKQTNLQSRMAFTPVKNISIQETIFRTSPKSLSHLRSATPSPSGFGRFKLSIFKRLDNN